MTQWPFTAPPNAVTFAHRTVAECEKPVLIFGLYPDGSYCAYTGEEVVDAEREIVCVCLSHILEIEPSVVELADLPVGWWAVRESLVSPWVREQIPDDEL
jgi:hypothetical protein